MKKIKQVTGNLEQSLVTYTEFIPIDQGFDVSIGYSEAIRLPNAKQLVETEFQRDMQLYQKMYQQEIRKQATMKKNKVVQEPIWSESVNEFLQIAKQNDIKPSKWIKLDKSQSVKLKTPEQPIEKVQAQKQLQSMDLEVTQSVKMTDSLAQAFQSSSFKMNKWKKTEQELHNSMKGSKLKPNKIKESCLMEAIDKGIKKVEQQPNVQAWQTKDIQASAHLEDLQTSTVTEEMDASNIDIQPKLGAVEEILEKRNEEYQENNIDNEEDKVQQQDGDDEQEDQQEEQQDEQQQEEQEQQEEEEQEDQQQQEQDEQQNGEQDEDDQDIKESSAQIDASAQVGGNQISDASIDIALGQLDVNKSQKVDSQSSKWKKQESTEPLQKIGSDQYQAENYLATPEEEHEWLEAQGILKGLSSLIN